MKWVTECRPHVDRCASAWFIRRFVDPQAEFAFIRRGEPVPRGLTPYDLPGVRFGHRNGQVTFDVLLREYPQKTRGLTKIAHLVRDIDLGEFRLAESRGLDTLLYGILLTESDDVRVLERTAPLFGALLRYYEDEAQA
jgi:hypothetical protein